MEGTPNNTPSKLLDDDFARLMRRYKSESVDLQFSARVKLMRDLLDEFSDLLSPIREALSEARNELAGAGGDVARFCEESRRGQKCRKIVDEIHAQLDAAIALLATPPQEGNGAA